MTRDGPCPVRWWSRLGRAFALGLLMASVVACDKSPVPVAPPLALGQPFPEFMLDFMTPKGEPAPAWQGKMLILNVWATWCPPCRREMPDLEKLSNTLDPARFAVLGLAIDEDTLLAQEFLVQRGITFPNFFDRGGSVTRPLGLQAYPETFLIASDGTLLRRMTGLREWASPEMIDTLEALYVASHRVGADGRP